MAALSISNHLKKLQQTMKKYSVLFAALAVIALAGCKKEESRNMNGIVIGGETYQNADKQAYSPDFQYVMFDGTDDILWNGVVYPYTMIDNPSTRNEVTTYSSYAVLDVPADAIVDDVTILYPGVADLEVDENIVMVDETPNAGLPNQITNCVWPMGYHSSHFNHHGQIMLKNAVAIVPPAVKYGLPCFQNIVTNNPTYFPDMTAADFATVADLPTMVVTSVELLSTGAKLTGNAHVAFDEAEIPSVVMDDPMGDGADVLTAEAPNMGIAIPAAGNNFKIVGNIPVTPNLAGATFQMKVYFDLYMSTGAVLHCVYVGDSRTLGADDFTRNLRTTCIANMFTAQNYTKVRILSAE